MQYKTCTKCGKELPATAEWFRMKKNRQKYSLSNQCLDCERNYRLQRYQENREELIQKSRDYREKHKKPNLIPEGYKKCTKCGELYPSTAEYFIRKTCNKTDGLTSTCKTCKKDIDKEYYEANKDKVAEVNKRWYEKHREKMRKHSADRYQENKEEIRRKQKEYNEKNRKRIRQQKREYHWANRDKILKKKAEYCEKNKEEISKRRKEKYWEDPSKSREKNRQRYKLNPNSWIWNARKRKAKVKQLPRTLTVNQWQQALDHFNYECAFCGMTAEEHVKSFGTRIEQEHFIPVDKGGEYTHNNIIPACKSCNSSKWKHDFFEWYPQQEFYSKEREQKILDFLGYQQGIQQLTISL